MGSQDEVEINGSRGTAHFVWRCSNCKVRRSVKRTISHADHRRKNIPHHSSPLIPRLNPLLPSPTLRLLSARAHAVATTRIPHSSLSIVEDLSLRNTTLGGNGSVKERKVELVLISIWMKTTMKRKEGGMIMMRNRRLQWLSVNSRQRLRECSGAGDRMMSLFEQVTV
jgi:hypothetical protein